jgi:methionyl-tRNA formyltransferase
MKVFILTTHNDGIAAHHLNYLLKQNLEVEAVILSKGRVLYPWRYRKRKFLKFLKIGLLGSLNGIRMRKWYQTKHPNILTLDKQCQKSNIPFFEVEITNSQKTIDIIKNINAELGISLGNGYINKSIFNLPARGMINIHHEILPEYQNAQSVIWQLYNMSKISGYTIHKIDNKIDNGQILYQEKVPINFKENLKKTVNYTLMDIENASAKGLAHVLKNFDKFCNNAVTQKNHKSYTTPSILMFYKIYRNFKILKKSTH